MPLRVFPSRIQPRYHLPELPQRNRLHIPQGRRGRRGKSCGMRVGASRQVKAQRSKVKGERRKEGKGYRTQSSPIEWTSYSTGQAKVKGEKKVFGVLCLVGLVARYGLLEAAPAKLQRDFVSL